jgi:hypothetical protein
MEPTAFAGKDLVYLFANRTSFQAVATILNVPVEAMAGAVAAESQSVVSGGGAVYLALNRLLDWSAYSQNSNSDIAAILQRVIGVRVDFFEARLAAGTTRMRPQDWK